MPVTAVTVRGLVTVGCATAAGADLLAAARERALGRGVPIALYTRELFSTGHDEADRAAVAGVPAHRLDLVGISLRGPRDVVDRIVKGARMHERVSLAAVAGSGIPSARCRARWGRSEVCTDATEDTSEITGVIIAERCEQEVVDGLDMAGKHRREDVTARGRDGDHGAALVVGRGEAGDQATLVEQLRLIGQAAAAVHHAIGEVGHAHMAVGGVTQACQELELDVAQGAGVAELLLDRGAQQTAHLREGEVRAELGRRQ